MNRGLSLFFGAVLLFCAVSCSQDAYDISRGIDKEITLFTDEVSLPIADIGPLTPKQLLGDAGLPDLIKSMVQEDEQGYLESQSNGTFYSGLVLLLSMSFPDPAQPADIPVSDYSGEIDSSAGALLGALGLGFSPQVFTLTASNPLTEGISVSGKLTLLDAEEAVLVSKEFEKIPLGACATNAEILRVEEAFETPIASFRVENMILHLPASIQEKDSLNGFGSFVLGYQHKGYLCMEADFPSPLPFDFEDLNVPLGQYKVNEATIRTEVSNEIPISLELSSVKVLVKQTEEDGREKYVPTEDMSITPGLLITSGSSGSPAVSSLEIVIKAKEGLTIPDIQGLELELTLMAPKGEGDKRINLNQSVSFNNLRATVSGGITIQGL